MKPNPHLNRFFLETSPEQMKHAKSYCVSYNAKGKKCHRKLNKDKYNQNGNYCPSCNELSNTRARGNHYSEEQLNGFFRSSRYSEYLKIEKKKKKDIHR